MPSHNNTAVLKTKPWVLICLSLIITPKGLGRHI